MNDNASAATTRRRNGTIASCEPCRKRKTRCGHERPVCNSCQQRGLSSTCFYRPSPVKKGRSNLRGTAADSHPLLPQASNNHLSGRGIHQFLAQDIVETSAHRFRPSPEAIRREQVVSIAKVLGYLRDCELLCNLVTAYYSASQASVIPSSLISSALPSLIQTINKFGLFNDTADDGPGLLRLSEDVLCSTSAQININASLTPSDFMGLYTGDTLRLEYLGIVFSVAARSCLIGLAKEGRQHDAFIQDMYSYSTICLRLAREVAPINDMLVWFGQDHLMLTACIEGDLSESTWRRLGELYSDILALGIYRELFNVADTPFFLTECRRKVFAKVYYIDKFVSTLFNRPPRLLKRYSDSKWPLDLTDAEVLAGTVELAEARAKLTPDGWNTEGKFCASSWARVRCITAEMLEEIYKYNLRPMTVENITKLKNISERNRKAWETIPSHLHYNTHCWTSELHPQVCFMLTVVQLAFLQCDFQIFRILERSDPQSSQQLLKISLEIISLIHELGSFRRKAVYLHLRFSYIILCYGLSPAIVLAKAAQNLARGVPHRPLLPPELDHSKLIRTLSVFISHLESISGPGEPNHDICVQASKTITKMLDELLNPSLTSLDSASTGTPTTQLANLDDMTLGIMGADTINGIDWGGV
ncbi:hypothetical protein MGYG_05294 [Nannizzia gypsea CBS 118893]|uniref:C6 finger domain transcription factor nscR n=1 Tax=Arthroderma gypseum (strain ATCC MYA-4604 / CBS 118893) TaxID=535722 RepID=E4UVG9_ARTGP|nr:hypothetical protein MGYG_05294 [Nannizzia gypsea CBS 118893]EFR02296.1 hypothetical protein MGYG_05294 [Nannizzia gypsea CBS 118893]